MNLLFNDSNRVILHVSYIGDTDAWSTLDGRVSRQNRSMVFGRYEWRMEMEGKSLTRSLAEFVVETPETMVPPEALHAGKRCLVDWIGCALAGSGHESVSILLEVIGQGFPRESRVIGRRVKLDSFNAALLNAHMAHVHDYDDTHLHGFAHATAPVWAAIMALAGRVPTGGREALSAFVLGYEIETRIGMVMKPYLLDRGWHMTAIVGGLGAAAAAGRLLHATVEEQMHAFGVAATYASGLGAVFGSMSKAIHPGKAAQSGLFAAMAAKRGFTGPRDVFTALRGFFHVHTGMRDLNDIVLSGPGHRFEVTRNSFKPYPSGVITHPAIDAIISIRDEHHVDPGQIEEIRLEVHPMVLEITGNRNPRTGLEGKFSVQHCVAAACLDGTCGLAQFTDERVRSEEVIDLRGRVRAEVNPAFRETEARVAVLLKDGRRLEKHVPHASGTEHNPLTDEQLQRKYEQNARGVLDREKAGKLAELIWNVEVSGDVASLLELT